jgi:hypothetical protein
MKPKPASHLFGVGTKFVSVGSCFAETIGSKLINAEVECLNNIFRPTDDTTFITYIPESQLIKFSIVMQSYFDINAYFHQKTSSSSFLGFGILSPTASRNS